MPDLTIKAGDLEKIIEQALSTSPQLARVIDTIVSRVCDNIMYGQSEEDIRLRELIRNQIVEQVQKSNYTLNLKVKNK